MGFGDLDMNKFRLQKDTGEIVTGNEMTREELRKLFSQLNIARIDPETTPTIKKTLKEHIQEIVKERMRSSEEYEQIELELSQILDELEAALVDM